MNKKIKHPKTLLLWLVIITLLTLVFNNFSSTHFGNNPLSYSEFLHAVEQQNVSNVTIDGRTIHALNRDGRHFTTYLPLPDPSLLKYLIKKEVNTFGTPPKQPSLLQTILINCIPIVFAILFISFLLRQMQGGGRGGPMTFGRSRAKLINEDSIKITFADVAGIDEAEEEVSELVDFLKDPQKYQNIGGKIPRGVLLLGPPGTGKTLLAKAVAGEAAVPFFTISGSDFVEMFVGVGASRVRDMFEQAKKRSPCIIFIDEIDAVARKRGAGLGGGHDEREQTLNQLLVEMDGFDRDIGIIIIAATNRPDVLDPALIRPGRFDRQITVPLPDIKGREKILEVHLKKIKKIAKDVNIIKIARGTPGFSGADLENLINEAALFTARSNKKEVSMQQFEKAKDKIIMGVERRSMVMNEEERKLTAYHEAGHAIVGLELSPHHDPVYKVSIIPRGRALGVTVFLPEQDRYSYPLCQLENKIASLFGGRLAEELIFGVDKVTTGAANDIEKATELARKMMTQFGFSKKLGPILYGENEQEIFLGHSVTQHKNISEETAQIIDQEVHQLIDRNYQKAKKILLDNKDKLHAMAQALIEFETINEVQINQIMTNQPITDGLESTTSKPSRKPRKTSSKPHEPPSPPSE